MKEYRQLILEEVERRPAAASAPRASPEEAKTAKSQNRRKLTAFVAQEPRKAVARPKGFLKKQWEASCAKAGDGGREPVRKTRDGFPPTTICALRRRREAARRGAV